MNYADNKGQRRPDFALIASFSSDWLLPGLSSCSTVLPSESHCRLFAHSIYILVNDMELLKSRNFLDSKTFHSFQFCG
ncbi:hypothetical protein R1flu_024204 [Riccia fluitans]|uniref:Uncharacterized protein n=1 Tax=Riccia fluitans TaxID=41844 RepID=A0ABD1XU80_9MARC